MRIKAYISILGSNPSRKKSTDKYLLNYQTKNNNCINGCYGSMTLVELISFVVLWQDCAHDRSGTFINTVRLAPGTGRSWTRNDIDPVPSLHQSCVYPCPSSLSSIAKGTRVGCVWRCVHMQSITSGGSGPHPKSKIYYYVASVINSPLWLN